MPDGTVQNLVTIWDVLNGRSLVHADDREGTIITYDRAQGELAIWSLTMNRTQGAGWWLRTQRRVAKHLTFERAVDLAVAWNEEWRDAR